MSERSAQCQECAKVFDCAPRGVLPSLCPECKSGAKDRPKRKASRAAAPVRTVRELKGAAHVGKAIVSLREELASVQERAVQISVAIELLEKLVA